MFSTVPILVFVGVVILIIIFQIIAIKSRFIKVPPNRLLVVYGKVEGNRSHVVVKNGSVFVWPVIQDCSWLSTEPFKVGFPNGDKLILRISRDAPLVDNAAEQLLGLRQEEIENLARGHIRQAGSEADLDITLAKIGLVRSDF